MRTYTLICEECNGLIAGYNHKPQPQQICSNCIAWIDNKEIESDIDYEDGL